MAPLRRYLGPTADPPFPAMARYCSAADENGMAAGR